MTQNALIIGNGISGITCAKLLIENGWNVTVHKLRTPLVSPLLLINNSTLELLCTIWGLEKDVYDDFNSIYERNVFWVMKSLPELNNPLF